MKRKRMAAVGVLAAAAVTAVSLYAAAKDAAVPRPDLTRDGFETRADYEVSKEADLVYPEETVLPYYRMREASPEELRLQAAACFGEDALERSGALALDPGTGGWTYREDMDSPAYLTAPKGLPSEEEAAEAAKQFVEEHGLFAGELGEPGFGSSSSELPIKGETTLLRRDVTFRPTVDGRKVCGGYFLRLTVGDQGEVTGADKQAGPLAQAGEAPLRPGEDAVREIREHPERFPVSVMGLESGEITGCELAYYADRETGFVTPVYVLSGEGRCSGEAEPRAFTAVVDAVRR